MMGMKQIQALPHGRKLNSHISIHSFKLSQSIRAIYVTFRRKKKGKERIFFSTL